MEVGAPVEMISPPCHIHRREMESFEVLDGQVTLTAGNERNFREDACDC
jgi:hypothetical protein